MRAAVIGASGYIGEVLVRLLSRHPKFELTSLTSRQFAGKTAGQVVTGLPNHARPLLFENLSPAEVAERADIFFLSLPHGVAAEFAVPLRAAGKLVVDLSADFRLKDPAVYKEFYGQDHPAPALLKESVYALPELHRDQLKGSSLLACPGCYPTSILLALAPALRHKLVDPTTIVVNSMSGISGAGKKPEIDYLFVEINETMRAYGVPKHRHLGEIEQEIGLLNGDGKTGAAADPITFIPHLIPISRGMLSSISVSLRSAKIDDSELERLYRDFYDGEPFITIKSVPDLPEVRNIVRSNSCEISARIDVRTGRLLIFSAIDNLVKGAAGQAIQASNARCGWDEMLGLTA